MAAALSAAAPGQHAVSCRCLKRNASAARRIGDERIKSNTFVLKLSMNVDKPTVGYLVSTQSNKWSKVQIAACFYTVSRLN